MVDYSYTRITFFLPRLDISFVFDSGLFGIVAWAQPQPLVSNWPPLQPQIQNFLSPTTVELLQLHMKELVQHVAQSFRDAGHSQSFEAAKFYLTSFINSQSMDDVSPKRRRTDDDVQPVDASAPAAGSSG